ncbi:MAG: hypothetical protein AAFU85_21560, partial [Planctomycetota bacterium]
TAPVEVDAAEAVWTFRNRMPPESDPRTEIARMSPRSTASLLILAMVWTSNAQAGGQDWLYGRPTLAPAYPVITQGFAAPTAQPFTPGVVQAQRPAAYYQTPTFQSQRPVIVSQRPGIVTSGFGTAPSTTTAQAFDNPSVYSGYPVGSAPVQSGIRTQFGLQLPNNGTVAPVNGLANQTLAFNSTPVVANRVPIASNYRGSAFNPLAPTTAFRPGIGSGLNQTTFNTPVTAQSFAPQTFATPTYAQPTRRRWRFGSGLARFFNSLLGRRQTDYYSSYYRAPITYYRPVSAIDPRTGTTYTVQQPCSSYVQQLQRVPINSFAPLQQGTLLPSNTCQSSIVATPGYGPGLSTITPGSFAPPSSVGQVGGVGIDPRANVIPIPSTGSPLGNTQPLTGSSPTFDPADSEPVPEPRLESRRVSPSDEDDRRANDDSGLFREEPEDEVDPLEEMELSSPATKRERPDPMSLDGILDGFTARKSTPSTAPTSLEAPDLLPRDYSSLRPIGAPESSRRESTNNESTPQLPPATRSQLFREGGSSASSRRGSRPNYSAPIREATSRSAIRQVSTWQDQPAAVERPEPTSKRKKGGWVPNR